MNPPGDDELRELRRIVGALQSKVHDNEMSVGGLTTALNSASDKIKELEDDEKSRNRTWMKVGLAFVVQAALVLIWAVRLEGNVMTHDAAGHREIRSELTTTLQVLTQHRKNIDEVRTIQVGVQDRVAQLSGQMVDVVTRVADDRFRGKDFVRERAKLIQELDQRYHRRSVAPSEGR